MSAISNYIHYQYNNWSGEETPEANASYLMKTYSNAKVIQQYNMSTQLLYQKLKKNYLNKINENSVNKMGEEEFFNLLNEIQKNSLTKAANKMVESISTTNLSMAEIGSTTSVNADVQKLQKVLNVFENILKQITNGTFSNNPIPVLTIDMLNGDTSINNIKNTFREAYLKDGMTFKVDSSYSRSIKSHANEINKMLASLSTIKSIQEGSMKNFDPTVQSQTINALVWSIYMTLNRIVGFVSEDRMAEYMPEYLKKDFEKVLPGNVSVSTEGTQGTDVLAVKTEDISISLDMKKMLENGEEGEISIRLPGVSLKRTNLKNNGSLARIRIKGTSLGNYLDNSDISGNLFDFYNAYADYNMAIKRGDRARALPAQLNRSAAAAMTNMYNYFHAAALPVALAGSLTSDDLAYFLVINNRVFNVIEIIQKIADGGDFTFVESNIATHQYRIKSIHQEAYVEETDPTSNKEGESRSDRMINTIRNLNVVMELNLALNKI